MNTTKSEQNQNDFELPRPVPRKLIRNITIKNPESKQSNTQVKIYDNQNKENDNLNEESIQGDES